MDRICLIAKRNIFNDDSLLNDLLNSLIEFIGVLLLLIIQENYYNIKSSC